MNLEKLIRFLDRLTEMKIPGMDMVIYKDHQEIFRHWAGYADIANKKPMCGDELYFLYSATKVMTCAAGMKLIEDGKILVTDPLYEYMPEFRDMMVKTIDGNIDNAKNNITVRDLFTMSAGFDYDLGTDVIQSYKRETNGKCPTVETMKQLAKKPLSFEPNTHWQYSLCHDVLGALIEVVSGKRFGEYLKENFWQPLGMNRTSTVYDDNTKSKMSKQYIFCDETQTVEEIELSNGYMDIGTEYESGGAGLISCVDDYIKFADAMANGGIAKNGERILNAKTIDLMRTNCLDETALKDFKMERVRGYGYGYGVRTLIDRAKAGALSPFGEFGWSGAAGAYVLIDPQNHIAVYYAQHMLNNYEHYVHPRLRNLVYSSL